MRRANRNRSLTGVLIARHDRLKRQSQPLRYPFRLQAMRENAYNGARKRPCLELSP